MSNRWIAFFASIVLPCIAAAQSPPASPPPAPETLSTLQDFKGPIYAVELVIVEGGGHIADLHSHSSDPALPAPSDPKATFASPEEGDAASANTPPKTIQEALRYEPIAEALKTLPPLTSISGEIVSPAPQPTPTVTYAKSRDLRTRIAEDPNVNIISAPRLSVIEKQEATVYVASQQVFDYLVPLGDGKFELRKTEAYELGIRLNVTVSPGDDSDSVVLSPMEIEVTSLDGREPVKGLNLDVGKPIVSARSLKTTVPVRLGEERQIQIPSGPNREAAVILRVERIESNQMKTQQQR
jgi:hypothetical protein